MELERLFATLRDKLSEEELTALEDEISAARSRGERHWLEDILEVAEWLPLPEVPPVVSRVLHSLIEGPRALESHAAELVRDTRRDRSLAGVRGNAVSDDWSLTYTSEIADLVIDVWPQPTGEIAVEGQLLPHAGLAGAVRASVSGPTTVRVDGDELGRFRFDQLSEDPYRIAVDDGRIEVTAHLDLEIRP